jgi:hypothetical protein
MPPPPALGASVTRGLRLEKSAQQLRRPLDLGRRTWDTDALMAAPFSGTIDATESLYR